ncbi:hypothetical protein OH799_16385 [Nocardia sp. NBC_00881]|uniref:hypothetical protein n=1 Tax=Nocardia sp. NBC_00881 TaxID=2975995 RepID=UPI003868525A|nr:hypothetical protein OH799_16385 [Nocardia sp. NBC_00881]
MAAPKPTRTLRLDHILPRATDIACTSRHSWVGEEHVILAVQRDPQSTPCRELHGLGISSNLLASALSLAVNAEGYFTAPESSAIHCRHPGDQGHLRSE